MNKIFLQKFFLLPGLYRKPPFPFNNKLSDKPTPFGAIQGMPLEIASPRAFGAPSNFEVKQNRSIFDFNTLKGFFL